jgi:hypothetical protein
LDEPHSVYVLLLAADKWYVGETNDVEQRLEQHRSDRGAKWTKKYYPLDVYKVQEVVYTERLFIEFVETIRMMYEKGIDNVRGAAFCQLDYTPVEKIAIAKLIAYCMHKSEGEILMKNNLI